MLDKILTSVVDDINGLANQSVAEAAVYDTQGLLVAKSSNIGRERAGELVISALKSLSSKEYRALEKISRTLLGNQENCYLPVSGNYRKTFTYGNNYIVLCGLEGGNTLAVAAEDNTVLGAVFMSIDKYKPDINLLL